MRRSLPFLAVFISAEVVRRQHRVPARSSASTARETLKWSLTSALGQEQTQFASSSSNRGDVPPKLSRHSCHSFLPLREFDQQLGFLFGPFAGFRWLHCCPRSEDLNLHQLRLRFGRDEGGRPPLSDSPVSLIFSLPQAWFLDRANPIIKT